MLDITDLSQSTVLTLDMKKIIGGKRSRYRSIGAAGSVNVEPPTALTAGSLPHITVEQETQMRAKQMGSGFLSGFSSGFFAGSV